MSALSHSGCTQRLYQMPVLKTVVEHATIKRIVKAPIIFLEVSISSVVGLLIGCDVADDHVEL